VLTLPVRRGVMLARWRPILLFSCGLVGGGIAAATALWVLHGLVGGSHPRVAVPALGLGSVAVVLRDFGWVSWKLPQRAQQVPQRVPRRGAVLGPLQFGFEMGTGVRTHLTSTLPYLVALTLLLAADSFAIFLLVGVGFGIGRAFFPVLRARSANTDRWDEHVLKRYPWIRRACAVMGVAAVAVLAVFLLP
jgi:hypothetical protein